MAIGEVHGTAAALALVDRLDLDHYYLLHATRADLLWRPGRQSGIRIGSWFPTAGGNAEAPQIQLPAVAMLLTHGSRQQTAVHQPKVRAISVRSKCHLDGAGPGRDTVITLPAKGEDNTGNVESRHHTQVRQQLVQALEGLANEAFLQTRPQRLCWITTLRAGKAATWSMPPVGERFVGRDRVCAFLM